MSNVIELPKPNEGNGAREACAQIFGQPESPDFDKGDWFLMQLRGEGFKVVLVEEDARMAVIEQCAKVAEEAADEWWKSLKAKDAGKPSVDFGSLPDHMINKIRALVHLPAGHPE